MKSKVHVTQKNLLNYGSSTATLSYKWLWHWSYRTGVSGKRLSSTQLSTSSRSYCTGVSGTQLNSSSRSSCRGVSGTWLSISSRTCCRYPAEFLMSILMDLCEHYLVEHYLVEQYPSPSLYVMQTNLQCLELTYISLVFTQVSRRVRRNTAGR